jgi:hypothetical protein
MHAAPETMPEQNPIACRQADGTLIRNIMTAVQALGMACRGQLERRNICGQAVRWRSTT